MWKHSSHEKVGLRPWILGACQSVRAASCSRAAAIIPNKWQRVCFRSLVPKVLLRAAAELARASASLRSTIRNSLEVALPGNGKPARLAPPLSLRPSSGRGRPTLVLKPAPPRARAQLWHCWNPPGPAVARGAPAPGCCGERSKGAARRGRGEALAQAWVAVDGRGRRMRALSPEPGTPRGARPLPRAHARAALGFPRPLLLVGAAPARARVISGPTGVAGFPPLQAPRPSPLAPRPAPSQPPRQPVSSRHGAGAARGRAPGTRLALGLALSATVQLAPPRAPPQSLAPEAPLSGDGGGSCFRFFPLPSVGSSILRPATPPTPLTEGGQLRLRLAAAAAATGEQRRPPLLPPRVTAFAKSALLRQDNMLCCPY